MYMRRMANGSPVVFLHCFADPEMTQERYEQMRRKYTSEAVFEQEINIKYDATSGARIYPDFNPAIHVIPHARIPKLLCRYRAIDPHPRTPHAFLWLGVDRWNDFYIYREMWLSKAYATNRNLRDNDKEKVIAIKDYVDLIAMHEGNYIQWRGEQRSDLLGTYRQRSTGERIIECYMDQAGKAFYGNAEGDADMSLAKIYDDYGIICSDPDKRHHIGENAIHELLRDRQHDVYGNWPRLHISDRCPELIYEFQRYRYQETRRPSPDKELKQQGVEARCHMLDLLRYLSTSEDVRWWPGRESEECNDVMDAFAAYNSIRSAA